MKSIIINITGTDARVEQAPVITSGTVGVPVQFTFDEGWDGFQKTAVFQAGGICRDVMDVKQSCTVPHEVLVEPYRTLRIGIYGVKGGTIFPTVWADAGQIVPGADPAGDASADPTLPVWQQIRENTEEYVDAKIGNISAALDALHSYAEALKGGGAV